MSQECPVCGTAAKVEAFGPDTKVECERCGKFALANSLGMDLPQWLGGQPVRAALMSHAIRRAQPSPGDNRVLAISPKTVESYWHDRTLPTPGEQADDLILWLGDNQENATTPIVGKEVALDAWLGMALPKVAGGATGLRWLAGAMEPDTNKPKNFLHAFVSGTARLQLTLDGWARCQGLKLKRIDSRTAFMAMKFGDPELNAMVDRCFRPAVKRTGFELRMLTDRQRAGLIDDQIRSALLTARFVVADLTHGSSGAYWEAGFADGRNLPVIYTCRRAEWDKARTHFDTNHMTTVIWDPTNPKSSEDEMVGIIRATLRDEAVQFD
jgi:hypothetical protein